jgi:hypothetical protein
LSSPVLLNSTHAIPPIQTCARVTPTPHPPSHQANLGWFQDAELVVISNTVWVGERLPCLTYGMRGMVTASIEVGVRVVGMRVDG